MKFLLATKENMTQFFREDGRVTPATVLSVNPNVITQVKTQERDGYRGVQLGFGERREKVLSKAVLGHMKKGGSGKVFQFLREFRLGDDAKDASYNEGDSIDVETFAVGDVIEVSGTTKGKGFQGVVKRHGFSGGRRTHGQKHSEREPGSIGATGPQRVFKGVRMAGRMGNNRVCVKGLKVLAVDKEGGRLIVSGSLPGKRGDLVEVRSKNPVRNHVH